MASITLSLTFSENGLLNRTNRLFKGVIKTNGEAGTITINCNVAGEGKNAATLIVLTNFIDDWKD